MTLKQQTISAISLKLHIAFQEVVQYDILMTRYS